MYADASVLLGRGGALALPRSHLHTFTPHALHINECSGWTIVQPPVEASRQSYMSPRTSCCFGDVGEPLGEAPVIRCHWMRFGQHQSGVSHSARAQTELRQAPRSNFFIHGGLTRCQPAQQAYWRPCEHVCAPSKREGGWGGLAWAARRVEGEGVQLASTRLVTE